MAETALDLNGRVVGNYRVVRLLGAGAMGKVFLLEHTRLPNTFAALKVLSPRRDNSSLLRERFVQEAMVAAAIGGDRVARPLDIGQFDADTPYIIMEYVEGRTLAELLESRGPLSLAEVLTVGWRVADTIALAHARGIIHRDLKPSNIMVTDEKQLRVKVLDFGVARAAGEIKIAETLETAVIGSPGYMSPEAATGMQVDALTDVFSLGVTIFKMLTDKLPFAGENAQATVAAILTRPPLRVADARPAALDAAPPPLEALIARTLHKTASERPTMAALRDALLALLVDMTPAQGAALLREPSPAPPPLAPAVDVVGSTVIDAPDPETMRRRLEQFARARVASTTALRNGWRKPLVAGLPLLLALGVAGWALLHRRAPVPPRVARVFPASRQLTTSGDVHEVEISVDGKQVLYLAGHDLYTRGVAGEPPRKLGVQRAHSAGWSRDGSVIYYDTRDDEVPRLYRIPAAGGPSQELPGADQFWDVSPDRKQVASTRNQARAVRMVDIDSKAERSIPIEGEYSVVAGVGFSPDGTRLAVLTQMKAQFALHLVASDGSRQTIVPVPRMIQIYWYDDRSILVLRHEPGALGNQLVLLKLDDSGFNAAGELRTIMTELRGYDVSTSSDGRLASYRAGNYAGGDIWTLSLDEGGRVEPRHLTFGTASTCNVSISPDGAALAITTFEGHGARVATMPFGGGEQHDVGHAARCAIGAWSPDGKQLAWRDGPSIVIVNRDGSGQRRLAPADASAGEQSLAWVVPDRIYYHVEGRRPWHSITVADGTTAPVSDDKDGWSATPRLAPDGKRVAVTWRRQPEGVYEIALADGHARFVGGPLLDAQGWSGDGRELFVANRKTTEDERFELLRLPIEGGATRPLATLPFSQDSSCSFASDGRRAVCVDRAEHADVWVIDNFADLVAAATAETP